jgi:formylglycine-generating enzyme required for sulfatase activity/predicted phosphodiesterase/energy-coupling factor transporter ATP-binding protein EcfA2
MKLRYLHLSDFHFDGSQSGNVADIFNRDTVTTSMLKVLEKIVQTGKPFDFVIITGDMAKQGKKEDYEVAKIFCKDLLSVTGLSEKKIYIVPGNHDVDRGNLKEFLCKFSNQDDITSILQDPDLLPPLTKKLSQFNRFANETMGRQAFDTFKFCYSYPYVLNRDEKTVKINIMGFNSALFAGAKGADKQKIALGKAQVNPVLDKLDNDALLNIALFHHPFSCFHPEEHVVQNGLIEHADFILTGHFHQNYPEELKNPSGKAVKITAGTCFDKREKENAFNFVEIDLKTGEGKVHFYKYLDSQHRWKEDTDLVKEKDGRFYFRIDLKPDKPGPKPKPSQKTKKGEIPVIPEIYKKWIAENYGYMDADKLHGKGDAFVLKLPEVFIPLYANNPETASKRKTGLKEQQKPAEQKPVDIEQLIAGHDHLLIEGHAGSGKTTILKHLTYCLSQQSMPDKLNHRLDRYLPVLILLKDLHGYFRSKKDPKTVKKTAADILKWYLKQKTDSVLDYPTVQNFIHEKKALFMLDGLDEIPSEYRDIIVDAFADLRIKNPGIKIVFTGRAHGVTGAAQKRFADRHIKVLSLNTEQVHEFIRKWFIYLYPGISGIGSKNAEAMINEIKAHRSINELTDNPLMLTAICILYHDGKELPAQRAELYKKFIENLIYRRFPKDDFVHDFLRTLAFKMHTLKIRSVDKNFALDVLREVCIKEPEERNKVPQKEIENIFDDCEPKCGLLKFESNQYVFWHLTFQEFLTADYIKYNHSDQIKAIKPYWEHIDDLDWYKEMIALYIGLISIDNKQTANDIVEAMIVYNDPSPYKRWHLAGQALTDMPDHIRDREPVKKTQNRLLTIMKSNSKPVVRAEAGEILGWLGDPRNLREFIKIQGGEYDLEDIGKVRIKSFEIAQYPVTNGWYREFVEADGYHNRSYWTEEGQKWLESTKAEYPRYWYERKWNCPNAPVVGVCWYEAAAFTRWLTESADDGRVYRLLTEKEWQAAAAGFLKRRYPWGNEWDENRCNSEEGKIEKTSAAGIFENGETPEKVGDLAGNVWEWTLSDYHSEKEREDFVFDEEMQRLYKNQEWGKIRERLNKKTRQLPVLRGGSWGGSSDYCRCAFRSIFIYYPYIRLLNGGFRCART